MEELPKLTDSIYKEIEEFEDYEYSNCIAYEMCIRNKEVKKLLNIIINKFDEIFEATEFEFIINKEAIEKECNELKKYGIGFNTLSSILTDIFYEINDIEVGKSSLNILYENEIILNRDKEYEDIEICDDGLIAQIDSDSDNCEIIPYEHINLDYVPFIGINYKRPKLELIQNKIFKIDLNLSLPKKELIDYVSKIIDEYEKDNNASIMSPLELIGFDRSRGNRVDKNKINKGLIAKKFFVYDYVSIRLEQIEDSNQNYNIEYEENKKIIENNPYITRQDKLIQLRELKKELEDNIKQRIIEIIEEFDDITKGTAKRYYYDIKPFIDDLKYKELITGIIKEDSEIKNIHETFFGLTY